MTQKPFISVIMPVYKCANDVGKAIESIQRQTMTNWELIVIDDCSPDNTCEVVESYVKKDARIFLLTKEKNSGPGASKNMGIEKAEGKYITFCDGDDWLDETAFEELSGNEQFNDDVIMAGFYRDIYGDNDELKMRQPVIMEGMDFIGNTEIIKYIPQIDRKRLFSYAVNKLYKKSIVEDNGIVFSDKRFGEDYDFNVAFFENIKTLKIINQAFYHYVKKGNESLTERYVPDFFEINKDRFDRMKFLMEKKSVYNGVIKSSILSSYIKHVLTAITRLYDRRANLTNAKRRCLVKEMLEVELSKEALQYAKPAGRNEIICNAVFKTKNITILLVFGRVLWFMQTTGKTVLERMKG